MYTICENVLPLSKLHPEWLLTLDCTLSILSFRFVPSLPCIRRAREWDRERERKFIYILFLPSLDGTTSGFFSSYISSDWLKGTEIFSLIGKLPGRCLLFDFLLFAVRTFSTTTMPIITQTRAVRRPTRIPNESIVDRSKVSDGSVVDGCTAKSVVTNEKRGNKKVKQNNLCNTRRRHEKTLSTIFNLPSIVDLCDVNSRVPKAMWLKRYIFRNENIRGVGEIAYWNWNFEAISIETKFKD